MEILILPGRRRKSWRVSLGGTALVAAAMLTTVAAAALFHAGMNYAQVSAIPGAPLPDGRLAGAWNVELQDQRDIVMRTRVEAEKSLDAMASRLSVLQSHVLRLDALGSRLATMANLDIEFGLDSSPGMGGPEPTQLEESITPADFLVSLDELDAGLQDKAEKLAAMESMLIDRSLQEQTLPEGRPASDSWISSLYGYRSDPMTGKKEFHSGIDFAGSPESPISAVAAGIVTWSGPKYGYGNLVEISHGNGYITRYGHNRKNLVKVGEKVEKGEVIALMGASGRSTGTHVHFEVVRDGQYVDPKKNVSFQ